MKMEPHQQAVSLVVVLCGCSSCLFYDQFIKCDTLLNVANKRLLHAPLAPIFQVKIPQTSSLVGKQGIKTRLPVQWTPRKPQHYAP